MLVSTGLIDDDVKDVSVIARDAYFRKYGYNSYTCTCDGGSAIVYKLKLYFFDLGWGDEDLTYYYRKASDTAITYYTNPIFPAEYTDGIGHGSVAFNIGNAYFKIFKMSHEDTITSSCDIENPFKENNAYLYFPTFGGNTSNFPSCKAIAEVYVEGAYILKIN
jgi:hypothetical protein